jgi:hypothetical protein
MGGYKGILDTLNIVNNCKYDFLPYKRLTNTYEGNKLYIKRTTDSATDYIHTSDYDSNGNINSSEIAAWANGGDVLLHDCYSETASGEKAYQADVNKAPKIVVSGVWQENGVKFDGSNDYMLVDDYSDIQIINPPLTIYINYKVLILHIGYVLTKNLSTVSDIQFSNLSNNANMQFLMNGFNIYTSTNQNINSQNKHIVNWQGKGTNQVKSNIGYASDSATANITLTNRQFFVIGNRAGGSVYFNGHIKSILIFNSNEYSNYNQLAANI